MIIRLLKKTDVKLLVDLCKAHALFEKVDYNPMNKEKLLLEYFFTSDSDIKCLVVEQDGKLQGYATFMKQFSTWGASFYMYLDCLYLKEEIRGKGVGAKLMGKIKNYAKTEDCKEIQWQTPDFNLDAIRFYKKIGGEPKSKERFSWKI
ncbi:GNAT family N-acetyltransferase [Aquimarina gracilis]|uniref:GNAT family N-acetyltransferase n=1 Tax=Aquimarina gracilis TaxID=874422 RepID=A0ABU5ZXU4_9FLAO|nr:GNAT family N-acetyltransferase [Aquimarina gracilis]MEB3346642.1 GNAT family N-acetyltransferase [Aquimarina gracilis]